LEGGRAHRVLAAAVLLEVLLFYTSERVRLDNLLFVLLLIILHQFFQHMLVVLLMTQLVLHVFLVQ
jgi:hypothetical protein